MEATELHMSFYDDFGTARIHAEIETDGLTIFSADALVYANGSVQMMTNLTGKLVLALPEGESWLRRTLRGCFPVCRARALTTRILTITRRWSACASPPPTMGVLMLSHLLGWVFGTQMDTGELYVFDDTYLDATGDARRGGAAHGRHHRRGQVQHAVLEHLRDDLRDAGQVPAGARRRAG